MLAIHLGSTWRYPSKQTEVLAGGMLGGSWNQWRLTGNLLATVDLAGPRTGLRWMRVSSERFELRVFGFTVVVALGLGGRRDRNDDSSL